MYRTIICAVTADRPTIFGMEAPREPRIRPLDPTQDALSASEVRARRRGRTRPLLIVTTATVLTVMLIGTVRVGPAERTPAAGPGSATQATTTHADGPTLGEQLPGFRGSLVVVSAKPDSGTVLVWNADASSPEIPFRTTAPRQAMLDVSGSYLLTLEVGKEEPILFVGTPSTLRRSYVGVTSAVWSASEPGRVAWIMRLPSERSVALVTGAIDEGVLVLQERTPFEVEDGDRIVGWDGHQFIIERRPLRPAIVTVREDPEDPATSRTITLSMLLSVDPDGVIRAIQPASLVAYGRDQSVISSAALALLDQLDRGRTLEEFGFGELSLLELTDMPIGLSRVESAYLRAVTSAGKLSNSPTGLALSTDGNFLVEGRYDRERNVTDLYTLSRFTAFRSIRGYFIPMSVDDSGEWVVGSQEAGQVAILGIQSDASFSLKIEGIPVLAQIIPNTTERP